MPTVRTSRDHTRVLVKMDLQEMEQFVMVRFASYTGRRGTGGGERDGGRCDFQDGETGGGGNPK